jgi:hypothetical protein
MCGQNSVVRVATSWQSLHSAYDDLLCVFHSVDIFHIHHQIWTGLHFHQNSMVRVRERTIPTKRPPLVGEVIVNFCG